MPPCFHLNLCELSNLWKSEMYEALIGGYLGKTPGRISFGSSVCEMQFMSISEENISFFNDLHDKDGISFSLTIPVARQRYADQIIMKIDDIVKNLRGLDEFVVNDQFIIDYLRKKYPGIHIIAGRRLCAFEHDFRMDDYSDQMNRALKIAEDLSAKVDGAEIDLPIPGTLKEHLKQPLSGKTGIPGFIRIHYPAAMMSCTYYCQYAAENTMRVSSYNSYTECRRQCQKFAARYANGVMKIGRGVYYPNRKDSEDDDFSAYMYFPVYEYMEMLK